MKTLPFWPIAWTLAIFATVIFAFDMLLGVLYPDWWMMQKIYEFLMPGFTFISWGTFFLGLFESFVGGFWLAVLFVPIYNYFARRAARDMRTTAPGITPASPHH